MYFENGPVNTPEHWSLWSFRVDICLAVEDLQSLIILKAEKMTKVVGSILCERLLNAWQHVRHSDLN